MIAAAASFPTRAIRHVGHWLSVRHTLQAELALVLVLYGLYEAARGLMGSGRGEATRHARDVASLERTLHWFVERDVQHSAERLPGLVGLLGASYLTFHLALTAAVLLWLHSRRPNAYPFVRTTLLLASGLALIGFLAYPTAPPRLAGLGIADTVSNGQIDLDKGLVSFLYNPYAAVPSMHIGYALIIAAGVVRYGSRRLVRACAALYPPFVLLVVVATGNHFLFDAVSGALVVAVAAPTAAALTRRGDVTRISALSSRPHPLHAFDQLAA